jgi:uncharacterized protein YlbG (UPF0298 family)
LEKFNILFPAVSSSVPQGRKAKNSCPCSVSFLFRGGSSSMAPPLLLLLVCGFESFLEQVAWGQKKSHLNTRIQMGETYYGSKKDESMISVINTTDIPTHFDSCRRVSYAKELRIQQHVNSRIQSNTTTQQRNLPCGCGCCETGVKVYGASSAVIRSSSARPTPYLSTSNPWTCESRLRAFIFVSPTLTLAIASPSLSITCANTFSEQEAWGQKKPHLNTRIQMGETYYGSKKDESMISIINTTDIPTHFDSCRKVSHAKELRIYTTTCKFPYSKQHV